MISVFTFFAHSFAIKLLAIVLGHYTLACTVGSNVSVFAYQTSSILPNHITSFDFLCTLITLCRESFFAFGALGCGGAVLFTVLYNPHTHFVVQSVSFLAFNTRAVLLCLAVGIEGTFTGLVFSDWVAWRALLTFEVLLINDCTVGCLAPSCFRYHGEWFLTFLAFSICTLLLAVYWFGDALLILVKVIQFLANCAFALKLEQAVALGIGASLVYQLQPVLALTTSIDQTIFGAADYRLAHAALHEVAIQALNAYIWLVILHVLAVGYLYFLTHELGFAVKLPGWTEADCL